MFRLFSRREVVAYFQLPSQDGWWYVNRNMPGTKAVGPFGSREEAEANWKYMNTDEGNTLMLGVWGVMLAVVAIVTALYFIL